MTAERNHLIDSLKLLCALHMNNERIIVSLTTWAPRIGNLPIVLDTIFHQTKKPDKVVLNLSCEEVVPKEIQDYIALNNIEVCRVPDTKVYKKLIPTLLRYPNDSIISIDDDFLYPKGMISDFWETHNRFPEFPISGNSLIYEGMQCHCGCASLTKAAFLGGYINDIDSDLMTNCKSDDLAYTFLSTRNFHPYIRSAEEYFTNMEEFNPVNSYTKSQDTDILASSYTYLKNRFGGADSIIGYINNDRAADLVYQIQKLYFERKMTEQSKIIRNSFSYRIGNKLIKPASLLKKLLNNE